MSINLKFDLTLNEASYLSPGLTDAIEAFEKLHSSDQCDENEYYRFLARLRHMLNYT